MFTSLVVMISKFFLIFDVVVVPDREMARNTMSRTSRESSFKNAFYLILSTLAIFQEISIFKENILITAGILPTVFYKQKKN